MYREKYALVLFWNILFCRRKERKGQDKDGKKKKKKEKTKSKDKEKGWLHLISEELKYFII